MKKQIQFILHTHCPLNKTVICFILIFLFSGFASAQRGGRGPYPPNITPPVDFNTYYWLPQSPINSWGDDDHSGEDWFYDAIYVVDQNQKPYGYLGAGYSELAGQTFTDGCGVIQGCTDADVNLSTETVSFSGYDEQYYYNRFEMAPASLYSNQTTIWCLTLPIPKLTMTDLNGNQIWYKTYGSVGTNMQGNGTFYKAIQLSNGNIIAVGRIDARSSSATDFIGYNPTSAEPHGVPTLCGTDGTTGETSGKPQGYIIETDINGNLIWQYQYGLSASPSANVTNFYDAVPLTDGSGNIFIIGKGQSTANGVGGFMMVINSSGQIVNGPTSLSTPANPYTTTGTTPSTASYNWAGGLFRCAADIPAVNGRTSEEIAVSGYFKDSQTAGTRAIATVTVIDPATLTQIASNTYSTYTVTDPITDLGVPDAIAVNIQYNPVNDKIIAAIIRNDPGGSGYENFAGKGTLEVDFIPAGTSSGLGIGTLDYTCGPVQAFDLGAGVAVQTDGSFAVLSTQLPVSRLDSVYYSDNCSPPYCPVTPIFSTDASCSGSITAQTYIKQQAGYEFWGTEAYVAKFNPTGTVLWSEDIPSATPATNFGSYDWSNMPPNSFGNVGDPTKQKDLKRQTCFYKIVPTPDGGFAMAGNNSNNLDDDALIKIQCDCQANLTLDSKTNNVTSDVYYHSPNSPANFYWSGNFTVDGQVTIGKGATLYITGPETLVKFTDTRQVGHPSNITVLPGGKLVIGNGATVTGVNDCPNNEWEGIYAQGNYVGLWANHVQTPAKSGIVQIESGATISNARNAVTVDGVDHYDAYWNPILSSSTSFALEGGIVQATGANFINNINAIVMGPFTTYYMAAGSTSPTFIANKSYLSGCTFSTDNTMAAFRQFKTFVTLNQVQGIQITACNFTNTQTNIYQDVNLGIGINAIDASFSVTNPCPSVNGNCTSTVPAVYFTGLDYGIRAQNIISSSTFTCNSQNFTKCVFGVECNAVDNAVITQNNFYLGNSLAVNEPDAPNGLNSNVGVAMLSSTGFTVEENTFTQLNYPTRNRYYTIGTWANNTQVADADVNQFYKNTFTGLNQAHCANAINRGTASPTTTGLSYFCNQHSTTSNYDIAVDAAGSIQKYQGSAKLSAGNIFDTPFGSDNNYGNLGNFSNDGINYYYSGVVATSNNLYPNKVTADVSRIPVISNDINTCPSHISGGVLPFFGHLSPGIHAGFINNYNNSQALISTAVNQISTLTDNGNTAALLSTINSAKTADQVTDLYTTLISASPYLSPTALTAFVNQCSHTVIPQSLSYQVLASNPEQLNNDTVWQAIQNMDTPFDSVYIYGLDSSRLAISAFGLTQATVINNTDSAGFAVRALLNDAQLHLYDTTGTGVMVIDTTAGFVTAPAYNYDRTNVITPPSSTGLADTAYINTQLLKNSPSALYNVAFNYLANADYTNTAATLVAIPTTYALNPAYDSVYNDIDTLTGILSGGNIDSLSTGTISSLQAIAAKNSIAASRAQNLLRNYYGQRYEAYPIINCQRGEFRSMQVPAQQAASITKNNVKVFPNPAGTYVTFAFKVPDGETGLNLYIYNATGIQMYESKLDPVIGQQVVLVNNWTNGIYGYIMHSSNQKIGSGTFVVSH